MISGVEHWTNSKRSHGMPSAWSLSLSISQVLGSGGEDEVGGLGWHKEAFGGKVDTNIMSPTPRILDILSKDVHVNIWQAEKILGQMCENLSPPLSLVTASHDHLPQAFLACDDLHLPGSFHCIVTWMAACSSWRKGTVTDGRATFVGG